MGVVHDIRLQELRLYTDYGRCCRPLFIVKDQQLAVKKSHIERLQQHEITLYGWQDLIQDGLLECAAAARQLEPLCSLCSCRWCKTRSAALLRHLPFAGR